MATENFTILSFFSHVMEKVETVADEEEIAGKPAYSNDNASGPSLRREKPLVSTRKGKRETLFLCYFWGPPSPKENHLVSVMAGVCHCSNWHELVTPSLLNLIIAMPATEL
ncbi:Uncharacterized protein APZ42_017169 [Daphnia magna]|uniref:Uncharacterized protein n=1 Tax=Daphnia magna TaxID=35525 RepID=A0A164ZPD0_9CRUS|nr:Uncharacterized protein APZ42_017169 [Daphnia magna]